MTELALRHNRERRKLSFFSSNKLWQIAWNALDRSTATAAISFLFLRAWRQLSVSFNKAEQQECPRRNCFLTALIFARKKYLF